ncbi:MAG TPA: hypothetical protein VK929_12020 [Longimicrobiales bacterium]|nr:hypothetical protein [Longimicrobiales bacterium]
MTPSTHRPARVPPAAVLLLGALLGACDQAPGPVMPASSGHPAFHHSSVESPEVQKWLAGLRSTLARYHRSDVAEDAGYDTIFQDACFAMPGVGGMGYHYVNGGLVNATVEEFAPEALMYEPQKNGRLRLVGVEYVVPFSDWTEADPPVLHGQEFHANETFGLWTLHVWAFKHNPAGMFADWNPTVTCDYAT